MDSLKRPVHIPAKYVHYANKHSIFDLQKNLLKKIILDMPEDPIQYLIDYLQKETHAIPSIFVIGPPCSGKQTIGKYIAKQLNAIPISAEVILKSKDLYVSSDCDEKECDSCENSYYSAQILKTRLKCDDCEMRGYVIIGFPETEEDAKALQFEGIFPDVVINLQSPDDVLIERAAGEVHDLTARETYHLHYNPPPNDPKIQQRLVPAPGNSPAEMRHRLGRWRHNFIGLRNVYSELMTNINSDQPLADLYSQALCKVIRPPRSIALWTPRVLLLGFSGSGRKSMASMLQRKYQIVPVHCGSLIRRETVRESKLGVAMTTYVEAKLPVPDPMVLKLLESRLTEVDCTLKGWVLYGFPRTVNQAKLLENASLEPNRIVFLNIPHSEAASRLNERRVDMVTGRRYHMCYNPPSDSLLDSVPQRIKKTPGTEMCEISEKLARYAAHRDDLMTYYGSRTSQVNADRDIETVFEHVESVITKSMPQTVIADKQVIAKCLIIPEACVEDWKQTACE